MYIDQVRANSGTQNSFRISLLVLLTATCFNVYSQQTVTFPSLDKLPITADVYKINETSCYIVLCHLAEHSRGEYRETAQRLNNAGYNCLAIDTRTGNEIFGIVNETAKRARQLGKPTNFLSSEQDILAAIAYADSLIGKGVILLGSSFSASLGLKISVTNPKVKAVVAFSPGEHFGNELKLASILSKLKKTAFLTSSKAEASYVAELFQLIDSKKKYQFVPIEKGAHGSIALWGYTLNNQEYWNSLLDFLQIVDL
jgi:dienelactone hydrolase